MGKPLGAQQNEMVIPRLQQASGCLSPPTAFQDSRELTEDPVQQNSWDLGGVLFD